MRETKKGKEMVIEKARELGIALSESEEFQRMLKARAEMDADIELKDLLDKFNQKQHDMMDKLSEDDMAENDVSDVHAASMDLERMQKTLLDSVKFGEMLAAQSEFMALMKKVNTVIGSCIGMETSEEENCSGDCSGCSGCKH